MKLHTDTREVLKGGIGKETTFSIKATGKAFQILSSGLYSNKILAIIRELSCNAYDAHVAAGKKDVPIEIQLPTSLKPIFSVKDFGTGLSNDQIEKLYTTYFDSTKQDSDEFIGALGLGSKSPFSYVTNFLVESRYNGVKSTYTAFINEQHLPSITKMNEEKTTEPNGMTVSLAVKRDDFEKFRVEAQKALMYFNPKVHVKGVSSFEPYSLKHTVVGSNWKVREAAYYSGMQGPYVVQGFVAYPIDAEQLKQQGVSGIAKSILGVDIDFTVEMGAVEVAASREALSYDKRTIENLLAVIEKSASEMRDTIQQDIDKCKTLWEATCEFNKHTKDYKFRAIFESLHERKPFTWKSQVLSSDVGGEGNFVATTQMLRVQNQHNKKLYTAGKFIPNLQVKSNILKAHPHSATVVYIDDQFKNASAMVFQDMCDNKKDYAIILRALSKTQYNQKEIDKIVTLLGDPKVVYISSLPKIVSAKAKYAKREQGSVLVWTGFAKNGGYRRNEIRRVFSRLCWEAKTIDLNKGGFYVPIERFTIIHDKQEQTSFDSLLEAAVTVGIINDDADVHGFTEKDIASVKSNKKWINLFTFIHSQFDKMNIDDKMINRVLIDQVINRESDIRTVLSVYSSLNKQLVDCSFKELVTKLYKLDQTSLKVKSHYLNTIMTNIGYTTIAEKKATKLLEEWKEVIGEYNMLNLIDWGSVTDGSRLKYVTDYVNMVTESR